jgi:hypothetical protein
MIRCIGFKDSVSVLSLPQSLTALLCKCLIIKALTQVAMGWKSCIGRHGTQRLSSRIKDVRL